MNKKIHIYIFFSIHLLHSSISFCKQIVALILVKWKFSKICICITRSVFMYVQFLAFLHTSTISVNDIYRRQDDSVHYINPNTRAVRVQWWYLLIKIIKPFFQLSMAQYRVFSSGHLLHAGPQLQRIVVTCHWPKQLISNTVNGQNFIYTYRMWFI